MELILLLCIEVGKPDLPDTSSGLSSLLVLLELEGFRKRGDCMTAGTRASEDVSLGNLVEDEVGLDVFFLAARTDFGNLDF
jgi:hypothetical protein